MLVKSIMVSPSFFQMSHIPVAQMPIGSSMAASVPVKRPMEVAPGSTSEDQMEFKRMKVEKEEEAASSENASGASG